MMNFDTIEQCHRWIESTTQALDAGRIRLHTEIGPLEWLPVRSHRKPWHRLVRQGLEVVIEYYDGSTFHYSDIHAITRLHDEA